MRLLRVVDSCYKGKWRLPKHSLSSFWTSTSLPALSSNAKLLVKKFLNSKTSILPSPPFGPTSISLIMSWISDSEILLPQCFTRLVSSAGPM